MLLLSLLCFANFSLFHAAMTPFYPIDGGYGVSVDDGRWVQANPVQIEIVDTAGAATWIRTPYSSVDGLKAKYLLRTAAGTRISVEDSYEYQASASAELDLIVSRKVIVQNGGAGKGSSENHTAVKELGFSSRYSLASTTPATNLRTQQFFVPGVWYLHSENVAPPKVL
jgi:hypothetical protein